MSRTGVAGLLVSAAMANVAYTLLIPLVPVLVDRFELTGLGVAAAFSGFALAKAVAQPIGGVLVDWTRNLHLLAAGGLGLTALATAGLAFADTGWQVLVLRLAWGFFEGMTMPVLYRLAIVLGSVGGGDPGRVLGWFGSSAVIGMAAGPVIVAVLRGPLGFGGIFVLGGLITAAGGLLLLLLRGAVLEEAARPATEEEAGPTSAVVASVTVPTIVLVGLFAVVDLVNNGLYAALEPVVPLHLERIGAGDPVQATAVLFTAGLVVFAVVSTLSGRFVGRQPLLQLAGVAFWLAAAGLLVSGLATGSAPFFVGFLLFMAAQPVLYVTARRGVSLLPRHQLGRAFGAFGLASDVGFVVGPVVGTLLYEHIGRPTFTLLAVVCAMAGTAALAMRRVPDRLLAMIGVEPEPSHQHQ